MVRLADQECRDIANLVCIAESNLDPACLRSNILPAMESMFRTNSGTFILADQHLKGLDLTNIVVHNTDESACSRYAQYYWRLDPMYPMGAFPRKAVLKNSDVMPHSDWLKLEYYNDFHLPMHVRWELDIYLRSGANLFGWISLFRSRHQPDFDERDTSKADILAPCITIALRNAILFSKTEEERNLLEGIIEFSSEGIIILDSELRPVYCNSRAKEFCLSLLDKRWDRTNGVGSKEFPVPFEVVKNCLALKRLSQSGSRDTSTDHRITIHEKQNKRFRIESSLVQHPFHTPCTPHFLISLQDLSETYKDGEEVTGREYSLTQREMDIIRCITNGLTNKEIAKKLFISKLTVRTHLENIFKRTGFRNRTQLASHIQSPWTLAHK